MDLLHKATDKLDVLADSDSDNFYYSHNVYAARFTKKRTIPCSYIQPMGLIDCIFQTLYVCLMTYNRLTNFAAIRHFYMLKSLLTTNNTLVITTKSLMVNKIGTAAIYTFIIKIIAIHIVF